MQKDPLILKVDILTFAWLNDLMIHPEKDLDDFCRRTAACGHCICRNEVLDCPCAEALGLCQKQGYCTCRLFLRKDLYHNALASARIHFEKKGVEKDDRRRRQALRRGALQTLYKHQEDGQ